MNEIKRGPVITFYQATDELARAGDNVMVANHDVGGLDPKEYHTSKHPTALQKRGELLADVLGLSPEERQLLKVAISWHDTTINYDHASDNILGTIRRHRGAGGNDLPSYTEGNEAQSVRGMKREAEEINKRAGRPVISDSQISTVVYAIDTTYPGVDLGSDFGGATFTDYSFYNEVIKQNPKVKDILDMLSKRGITKGPHFFQPHLEEALEQGKKIPLEVLTMALVDLGAAGMGEEKEFKEEGDDEYRELHENMRKPDNLLRLTSGDAEQDSKDREEVTDDMLSWKKGQVGFAAWQMLRFEKVVLLLKANGQLDTDREQRLRSLFSHFESNIIGGLERWDNLRRKSEEIKQQQDQKAAFAFLARDMGYPIAF